MSEFSTSIRLHAILSKSVLLLLFVSDVFLFPLCCFGQDKEAVALVERARLMLNDKSYDSAIFYADKGIKKAVQNGDTRSRIKAMRFKGKSLAKLGREKEAIDLYFAALRLCQSPAFDREIAYLYGEIGYMYFVQGHSNESKSYYKKEIEILTKNLGRDSVGNQWINMSVMHSQLHEQDSAKMALDRVKDILTRFNDSSIRGYYFFNMGAHFTSANNPDSARTYYLKAYDIWRALKNESQLFRVTFNLGFYYFQKKDYREAIRYYHLSEAAARKFGSNRDIAHVYGTIAESYAAIGDYRNAYNNLYLYATLNDSLNKLDINSYVLRLDKQFQTEKSRELIQDQELKLRTARLEVQQQRNTILIIIIVFVLILFAAFVILGYTTFKNRVRQKVDEAKSRFFANVAHEIRTPLSMIQAPLEVLQRQVTDEGLQKQIAVASRNTRRLNELISQMLDISRIDAAGYTLHESVGNLEEFARQLFQQYHQLAEGKNITLTCETDSDAGNVMFDRDVLEKIIDNLAGNAIKYTPQGGAVGVTINATKAGAEAKLVINVWDSGPGIDIAEKDRIFDRFYRSEAQVKAGIKGVGIGLSLVKELVDLMHGTISVESAPGKGAVFTVTCSLACVEKTVPTADGVEEGLYTVLIVEDDRDILDFNAALMKEEGYHVLTATNGVKALEIVSASIPDIVITDLMMPGMDGIALLTAIRKQDITAHIPVIILSAKASADAKSTGISVGAQAYLPKPFSPAELKGLVKNQLQLLRNFKSQYQPPAQKTATASESLTPGDDPFVQKCFGIIQEHLDDPQLSVEKLAELMTINRSHFQRKIKALTGYSPSELIKSIRLERAREMLLKKEGNITEIAYAMGFTSQSYFTKCFSDHFGYPPSQAH